jgi:hypothetical protein
MTPAGRGLLSKVGTPIRPDSVFGKSSVKGSEGMEYNWTPTSKARKNPPTPLVKQK